MGPSLRRSKPGGSSSRVRTHVLLLLYSVLRRAGSNGVPEVSNKAVDREVLAARTSNHSPGYSQRLVR